jgi:hypothetical protein
MAVMNVSVVFKLWFGVSVGVNLVLLRGCRDVTCDI